MVRRVVHPLIHACIIVLDDFLLPYRETIFCLWQRFYCDISVLANDGLPLVILRIAYIFGSNGCLIRQEPAGGGPFIEALVRALLL